MRGAEGQGGVRDGPLPFLHGAGALAPDDVQAAGRNRAVQKTEPERRNLTGGFRASRFSFRIVQRVICSSLAVIFASENSVTVLGGPVVPSGAMKWMLISASSVLCLDGGPSNQ